jgi:hypothetical protein
MNKFITLKLLCASLLGALFAAPVMAADFAPIQHAQVASNAIAQRLHSMPVLVIDLLRAINTISGYQFPEDFPNVAQVSHQELERHACGGKCTMVKAAYVPEQGIFVDSRLDPLNNVMDRSILLHELVHHVQAVTGRYADLNECERRQSEEAEAFAIQNGYLASVRSGLSVALPRFVYRCDG